MRNSEFEKREGRKGRKGGREGARGFFKKVALFDPWVVAGIKFASRWISTHTKNKYKSLMHRY